MSTANTDDVRLIQQSLQCYLDGAQAGDSSLMKPAFHEGATMFGFIGEDLVAGAIENLYQWNDQNGPAKDISSVITNIDIEGSIATARVESDNWTGYKFTDFFTLLKVGGEWKIINKVFHLHA
jgi:hypothetical protein